MKMPSGETPEQLALHQVHALCLGHVEALQDALKDMAQRALASPAWSSWAGFLVLRRGIPCGRYATSLPTTIPIIRPSGSSACKWPLRPQASC